MVMILLSPHSWVFSGQPGFASSAQVLDPKEILDLQIKRESSEAVSIFFDFVLGRTTGWASWVVKELSDWGSGLFCC